MSNYINRHVVVSSGTGPISLVKVKSVGRIMTSKTIGKYKIIYPGNCEIDEKRRIQMTIRSSSYSAKRFLDERSTIQALFEKFGG